jgi:hypothetical protein
MLTDFLALFFTGSVGAAAPEIVRAYRARTRDIKVSKGQVAISAVFFLLGGFVGAFVLGTTSYLGAFYGGVTAPTLISNFGGTPPRPKPRPPVSSGTAPTQPSTAPQPSPIGGGLPNPSIPILHGSEPQFFITNREYLGLLTGSMGPREPRGAGSG